MKWTRDMAVGIESIDEQHRQMFMWISRLLQAIREQRCKNRV